MGAILKKILRVAWFLHQPQAGQIEANIVKGRAK
jgi:hypothetical protein